MAEKYVVFKAEDYAGNKDPLPVPDAVVLRKKDLTVAPLLHAYSSMLISFIELSDLSSEQEASLREIADWAHMEATDAEKLPHRRLPD